MGVIAAYYRLVFYDKIRRLEGLTAAGVIISLLASIIVGVVRYIQQASYEVCIIGGSGRARRLFGYANSNYKSILLTPKHRLYLSFECNNQIVVMNTSTSEGQVNISTSDEESPPFGSTKQCDVADIQRIGLLNHIITTDDEIIYAKHVLIIDYDNPFLVMKYYNLDAPLGAMTAEDKRVDCNYIAAEGSYSCPEKVDFIFFPRREDNYYFLPGSIDFYMSSNPRMESNKAYQEIIDIFNVKTCDHHQ